MINPVPSSFFFLKDTGQGDEGVQMGDPTLNFLSLIGTNIV